MKSQKTVEQRIENFKGIYNRLEKIVDNLKICAIFAN